VTFSTRASVFFADQMRLSRSASSMRVSALLMSPCACRSAPAYVRSAKEASWKAQAASSSFFRTSPTEDQKASAASPIQPPESIARSPREAATAPST